MAQITTKTVTEQFGVLSTYEKNEFAEVYGYSVAKIEYIINKASEIGDRVFRTQSQITKARSSSLMERKDEVLASFHEFTNDLLTQDLSIDESMVNGELLSKNLGRQLNIPPKDTTEEIGQIRGRIRRVLVEKQAEANRLIATIGGHLTDGTSSIDPLDRKAEYVFYDAFALIRGPKKIEITDFNQVAAAFSVNLSTDITPGNFSITFANPFEQFVDDYGVYSFKTGDTIRIYATRRFQDDNKERYMGIFWGIIEQVSDEYSDGQARVTISGQDITAWLQYTTIRLAPTLAEKSLNPGITVNKYGHKYSNMPALAIIADVIFNDIREFNSFETYSLQEKGQGQVGQIEGQINDLRKELEDEKVDAAGREDLNKKLTDKKKELQQLSDIQGGENQSVIEWWQSLFLEELVVKVFGYDGVTSITTRNAEAVSKDSLQREQKAKEQQIRSTSDPVSASKKEVRAIGSEGTDAIGQTEIVKALPIDEETRCVALKVLDRYIPHRMFADEPIAGTVQLEDMPKIEIIRRIIEGLMFEFFMDRDGSIVLKPPFYNEYPVNNDTKRYRNLLEDIDCEGAQSFEEADKFDAESATEYTIKEIDIISFTIKEDSSNIITRQEVTAEPRNFEAIPEIHYGAYQNNDLVKRYGIRVGSPKKQRMLNSSRDAITFAKALMDHKNVKFYTGTITIIGRPELHLGRTIYFEPRNVIFYITALSHSFTPGGTFTTTLTLIAGRRMFLKPDGMPRVNVFDGEQFLVDRNEKDIQKSIAEKKGDVKALEDALKERGFDPADPGLQDKTNKSTPTRENLESGSIPSSELAQELTDAKASLAEEEVAQKKKKIFNDIRGENDSKTFGITDAQIQALGGIIPRRITDSYGRRMYGTLPYGLLATPPKREEDANEKQQKKNTDTKSGDLAPLSAANGAVSPPISAETASQSPEPSPYIESDREINERVAEAAQGKREEVEGSKFFVEKTKNCTEGDDNKSFNPSSIVRRRIVTGIDL